MSLLLLHKPSYSRLRLMTFFVSNLLNLLHLRQDARFSLVVRQESLVRKASCRPSISESQPFTGSLLKGGIQTLE